MSRKRRGTFFVVLAAAFLFALAATAGDVYARGEGGHAPEGTHLKGPALQGMLSATYVEPFDDGGLCFNDPYGCAIISFNVKCKNQRGVTYDTVSDLEKFIYEYTEEDLEGLIFIGAGPLGCLSAEGGEDIIIKNVKSFSNTYTAENPSAGGVIADLFLLYLVEYNPNNPVQ